MPRRDPHDTSNDIATTPALGGGLLGEIGSRILAGFVDRADSWVNAITGLGGPRDRTAAMRYSGVVCRLTDAELASMYATEDFSARIVDVYPREALREGFEIGGYGEQPDDADGDREARGPGAPADGNGESAAGEAGEEANPDRKARRDPFDDDADGARADAVRAAVRAGMRQARADSSANGAEVIDPDLEKRVCDFLQPYAVEAMITEAAIWGRLFGGAVIMIGSGSPEGDKSEFEPGDPIDYVRVVDCRFVKPTYSEGDPSRPLDNMGRPLYYNITPLDLTASANNGREGSVLTTMHRSRLVFFPGDRTEARAKVELSGWDYSVLQRPYNALKADANVWSASVQLAQEASIGVTSVKGLFSMVAGNQKERLSERLRVMQMSSSIARNRVLDMDQEKYERINSTFAGIGELNEHSIRRIAASAEIPVTVLCGEAPAGLNATGDSDLRWFLARVNSYRTLVLESRVRQLVTALLAQPGSPLSAEQAQRITIRWPDLWTPSAAERADIYSKTASADVAYITAQVVLPEEIALSRFGDDGYSQDTTIKRELREEMLDPPAAPVVEEKLAGQDPELDENGEPIEAETDPENAGDASDPETGLGKGGGEPRAANAGKAPAGPGKAAGPLSRLAAPAPGKAGAGPALGAPTEDKQKEAMNGAQIAALQELVRATAAGEIPRESMQAILELSFGLPPAVAGRIIPPPDFQPPPPPPPKFGFGGPPGAPGADGGKGGGAPPSGAKGDPADADADPEKAAPKAPPFAKG
jgi:phage-related protein (TIGR01555 family)